MIVQTVLVLTSQSRGRNTSLSFENASGYAATLIGAFPSCAYVVMPSRVALFRNFTLHALYRSTSHQLTFCDAKRVSVNAPSYLLGSAGGLSSLSQESRYFGLPFASHSTGYFTPHDPPAELNV